MTAPAIDFKNLRILIDEEKLDRAIMFMHKYEALYPNDSELCALLGEAYHKFNNMSEAERYYRKTLKLNPKHIHVFTLLESTLREQGRFEECKEVLKQIVALDPRLKGVATSSASMIKLANGDLKDGFQDYENRYAYKHMAEAYAKEHFPRWKGATSLVGKRVLLCYEQGLGDTLQFVRYANILKQKGASKVGVLCKPAMHRLVGHMASVDELHSVQPTDGYDHEVMMMSMPAILKTSTEADIPSEPYLGVKEEDKLLWAKKMGPFTPGKLRVGMVWSGELKKALNWQAKRMNLRRSIPLNDWRPILDVDCDFFSLQKGEMESDLVDFSAAHPIKNVMGSAKDFYDTACVIANLDLVITVDTSVAHLAAGMGKPTWIFHRVDGDWRWMLNRSDSPWYPSAKIFRQEQFEKWSPTVNKVADELQQLATKHVWDVVKQQYMREPSEIPQEEKDYYKNLIKVPSKDTCILNVFKVNFAEIKNGDLVALINILEHLRIRENDPKLQFFVEPTALHQAEYCKQFYEFIKKETDYFSSVRGRDTLNIRLKSVWNYRMALGDIVKLKINREKQKKISIFPLFDAVTNPARNWPIELAQEIINRFSGPDYADYTKVFCGKVLPKSLDLRDFAVSGNFKANLSHLLSSEIYVGGDTGMTHFANSLENGPKTIFYIPKDSARNTYPLHFEQGELNFYEGTPNGL